MKKKKSNPQFDLEELENARVAYQVASNLRTSRADELWSQFNALVTANSIILAVETFTIGSGSTLHTISIIISMIGIFLCAFWYALHIRGLKYTTFYLFSAREIEERYFGDQIRTLSRGEEFADGSPASFEFKKTSRQEIMPKSAQLFRSGKASILVIASFISLHIVILVWIIFILD